MPFEYQFNLKKQKVTLAIHLIDYYTGRKLTETAKVSIENSYIKPVIKQDGIYVFIDLEGHDCKVIIECQRYISQKITIDHKDKIWESKYPIKKIFLLASKKYSLLPFTTFISCKMKPFTYVYGIPIDEVSMLTLAFCKETDVQFYTSFPIPYINHGFAFYENNFLEFFTVISQNENGYIIDKRLKNNYPQGTKVYPLSVGQADKNGDLLLLLWGLVETNKKILLKYEDKSEYVMIQYGRGNIL